MIRPVLAGGWAALRTPLWLRGSRVRRLMDAPRGLARAAGPEAAARPGADAVAARALRASRAALRLLARPPGSPWRNTCLYRSAAGCLVLRGLGVPARLRLGVRSGAATPEADAVAGVAAHAWIDAPGIAPDAGAGGEDGEMAAYVELRRAGSAVAAGRSAPPSSREAGPG